MIDDQKIKQHLNATIDQCPEIPNAEKLSGKVRESYVYPNGTRAIVVTDRISAFDFILGTVPFKGRVLSSISNFWFKEMDKIGIRTHHLSAPHPNISVNKEAKVLPIEFVVRSYLTGSTITSSWYAYQNNDQTICGIRMPDGMKKNQKFSENILTPTTKADKGGRDENVSREEIIARGIVPAEIYEEAEYMAMRMFAHGQKIADEKGLILVDTKYEMGLDENGQVIVVDEIHTPDSSRYWIKETYEERLAQGREPDSLDKEFVRNMIVDAGYDVNSDENPAEYMTDDIRINAAKKYLALRDIFLDTPLELEDETVSIEDVLKNAS